MQSFVHLRYMQAQRRSHDSFPQELFEKETAMGQLKTELNLAHVRNIFYSIF